MFGPLLEHPNIWRLNRRSVAGCVAAGFFAGLIPGPVQVLSAAVCSVLFKVNLPVAIAVTFYTNPLTIVPLYLLAYQYGLLLTGGGDSGRTIVAPDFAALPWSAVLPATLDWMAAMGKPFIIGLIALDASLALLGYLAVWWGWRWFILAARRRQRSS